MIKKSTCIYILSHDISKILATFLEIRLHILGFHTIVIDMIPSDEIPTFKNGIFS